MDSLTSKLQWCNGMILLSNNCTEIDESNEQKIPCKRVLASTPWKRQRDEILFKFLSIHLPKSVKPSLIFTNSIIEVNLLASALRTHFPAIELLAIGSNLSITNLFAELESSSKVDVLVLSAQMALAAFVHGIIRVQDFSLFCFADARGANQNHPFCILMNHFYTPRRLLLDPSAASGCVVRVVGFTEETRNIEQDMFSKRDWIKTLKHYTHTFHCVPMSINGSDDSIDNYLQSFTKSPLFDPLSIYESTRLPTCITDIHKFPVIKSLSLNPNDDFIKVNFDSSVLVLEHETTIEEIPLLISFLNELKSQFPQIKRLIHTHNNPEFAANLSIQVALQTLSSQAVSFKLDPEMSNLICKDATELFSQSEHVFSMSDGSQERIVRNPKTGSLLIESTAIPVLVRACTLLSRQFRQNSANETVKFKTLRVFPVNEIGEKTSNQLQYVSLLILPNFMYERIKQCISKSVSDGFHLQGPPVTSRHRAQCCVAFEAGRLLISTGILDDNLLLASEYRKTENEEDNLLEEEEEGGCGGGETNLNEIEEEDLDGSSMASSLSFNELIPDSLILKNQQQVLLIYAIEYELEMQESADDPLGLDPEPIFLTPHSRLLLQACPEIDFFSSSKSNRAWAIILPTKLPEGFVPIEIPIGPDHRLKTRLRLIGEMPRDTLEYEKLLKAQQSLFGMFNMKPISIPTADTESFKDTTLGLVPNEKMPFYLVAPLINSTFTGELVDLESIPEVYNLFKKFVNLLKTSPFTGVNYFLKETADEEGMKGDWKIDWKIVEGDPGEYPKLSDYLSALEEIKDTEFAQLEEQGSPIDFKRFALERLAFLTPHTRIFYRMNLRNLPTPIYPTSPFSSPSYPLVTSHAEYVLARYKLEISADEMNRQMLAVKRIENWSDLAVWISNDGASKKRRKKSHVQTQTGSESASGEVSTSLLIPELSRIFPVSYSTFRIAMLLPRIAFEIERQLRISQFFTDKFPSKLPKPSHARQVEALTASTAALSYSYEQLEVLGDSFLKYYSTLDVLLVGSGWSEGRLSSHRQKILCNANLRRAAEDLQVTTYASFTPFFSKLWTPPLLIHHLPPPLDVVESALNQVLFSPEDRWKLLAEAEGKRSQSQLVYQVTPDGNLKVFDGYRTKEQAKNSTGAIYKYGQLIPPKSLADILEALIGIYYIDCGVQAALAFLIHCNILKPEILAIRRIDPLSLLVNDPQPSFLDEEKLRRRKLTPMNRLVLDHLKQSTKPIGDASSVDTINATLKEAQSIEVSIEQKVQNVTPYAPPFTQFPFDSLEAVLGYKFNRREILFMACTHSSIDSKLNNERLEWIGDAAIDWLVARHYWFNYRLDENGSRILDNEKLICKVTGTDTNEHSPTPHIPKGILPLSPESLTNSRQSAINNEEFARLVIKFSLHRFLRINSPHLQIEIERFAKDLSGANLDTFLPKSLDNLHTPVSIAAPKVLGDLFEGLMGAILMDTHFEIDGQFQDSFQPFLTSICSDPLDLPTNAIQETLHLYARLGIPRHQIVYTFKEISVDSIMGINCQVWVRERCVAEAEGSNKVVAKKLAMERALFELTNNPTSYKL